MGIAVAGTLAGCQTFNDKAHNTSLFIAGNTEELIPRTPAEVTTACRQTVDDANLLFVSSEDEPIKDDPANRRQSVVTARTHGDEKVTFTIVPMDKGVVLKVNSGPLGDTEMRHRLIDTVNRHLGYNPQPATQPT
jgi:hypothetical protein